MTRYNHERSRNRELEPSINRTAIMRIITELTEPQRGQLDAFLKYYFTGIHRGIAPQASPQVKSILVKLFDSCSLGSPNSSKSPLRNAPLAYKFEKMGKKHQNLYFIVHGTRVEEVLHAAQSVIAAEAAQKRQALLAEFNARQAAQDSELQAKIRGATTTEVSPEHSARILYEQVQNLFINLRLNSTTAYEFQLNNANDPLGDHLQACMQLIAANPDIADTFRVTLFPNAGAAQTIRISWAKRSNNVNVRTKKLAALEKILMQGVTVPVVVDDEEDDEDEPKREEYEERPYQYSRLTAYRPYEQMLFDDEGDDEGYFDESDDEDPSDLESETAADAAILHTLSTQETQEKTSTLEHTKEGIIAYIMERLPTNESEPVMFGEEPEVVEFLNSALARAPFGEFYIEAGCWSIESDTTPFISFMDLGEDLETARAEFQAELKFYMQDYYILPN